VARDRAPSRPDTVAPANLLGPYEGQVLEQETGRPVVNALVIGSFGYSRGAGLRAAAGADVVQSKTDDDGRYRIEAPQELPTGPSVRLDRFTLLVYVKGFVAYRSDRVLTDSGVRPRPDFAQRGNRVLLRKLDPVIGHRRHLEFIGMWGAPGTLADAIAWEFEKIEQDDPAAPSPAAEQSEP